MRITNFYDFLNLGHLQLDKFVEIQDEMRELRQKDRMRDTVVFVEHPAAISISKHHVDRDMKFLKVPPETLKAIGIPIVMLDRGGSVAVHGKGILGCYIIAELKSNKSGSALLCSIEEWVMRAFSLIGVQLYPYPPGFKNKKIPAAEKSKYRGLWRGQYKIATRGAGIKNRVSKFGISINISPNPSLLSLIHPCGIKDYTLGSIERLTKQQLAVGDVIELLKNTPL